MIPSVEAEDVIRVGEVSRTKGDSFQSVDLFRVEGRAEGCCLVGRGRCRLRGDGRS